MNDILTIITFLKEGQQENPEEKKYSEQEQTNSIHICIGGSSTGAQASSATLAGDERPPHYAIPANKLKVMLLISMFSYRTKYQSKRSPATQSNLS